MIRIAGGEVRPQHGPAVVQPAESSSTLSKRAGLRGRARPAYDAGAAHMTADGRRLRPLLDSHGPPARASASLGVFVVSGD